MSSARFAPITSILLARKGEAKPWTQAATVEAEDVASIPWRPYVPVVAVPAPAGKDKACSVRISAHDFQRLGILAVKKNSTRQQLLKQALAEFLAAAARDCGCACLQEVPGLCGEDCGGQA
jgi:hypothetical protein